MKFRFARHTNNLDKLKAFYQEVIGLDLLGSFENHDNYNGVFLGKANADWHLEFTESDSLAKHYPDTDDLLVFYVSSEAELRAIIQKAKTVNARMPQPKNPYWKAQGIQVNDPDDFGIILSLSSHKLQSKDSLTALLKEKEIETWNHLLKYVKALPYGRNTIRKSLKLVLIEGKGTCSSKHALLKELADLNGIPDVKLMLGIYKMSESNTSIGALLSEKALDYIPEAHCYLKINNHRIDVTNSNSNIANIENDILEELEITPNQVINFKLNYHQNYLKKWIKEHQIGKSFQEVWRIREDCIRYLSR